MNNTHPTVAIVDDHNLMRDVLAAFLLDLGYNVVTQANNGRQLLDQLNVNSLPDLCLLDVDMPVMNGYETARYLREHHASIKILATSVFYNEDKKEKMLRCGACRFISKISNPEEWKKVLQEVCPVDF
jgi:DNA-binding NarL/FixJ family response regulator